MNNVTANLSVAIGKVRNTPRGILVLGIFALGLILRGPMAAVAPLATQLSAEYGVDLATVGLLSGIPVFCYAAFSPLASFLIARRGLEFTFIFGILACALGITVRSFGGFETMVAATILIGASAAFGNISVPLIAARDFPEKFALVTGLCSAAMNLGNVAAFALTVPISALVGFRAALFSWALICLFVLWIWIAYVFRRRRGLSRKALRKAVSLASEHPGHSSSNAILTTDFKDVNSGENSKTDSEKQTETVSRKIWKMPFTYGIAWVFICQCVGFFGLSAWLPTIFESRGLDSSSAGLASSIFQLLGILGSVSIHSMLKKFDFIPTFLILAFCWISLPLGLIVLPQFYIAWLFFAGFAQGAHYILMFSKVTQISKTEKERRELSASTQMSAYFVAGLTPTAIGMLQTAVQNWTIPIAIVLAMLVSMLIVGLFVYKAK